MLSELVAAFNSSYAVTATSVGIFVLFIKILTMLGQALEFHDKHFVEKRLRRLVLLRENTAGDDLFKSYLDSAVSLEAFRLASGIRAGASKAAAIMRLSMLGHWDAVQIRRVSGYLVAEAGSDMPKIEISRFDVFSAWYGLISGVLLLLLGALGAIALAVKVPGYGFFVGIGFFTLMILAAGWLAMDYGRYKIALRMRSYLEDNCEEPRQ